MSIQVQEVSKYYDQQLALNNVCFTINKGEIVGFLGPNGAGKSTLLKILTSYLPSSSGDAIINGYQLNTQSKQVKASIGYLPEHNPLYLDMYVREYLLFNASIYKVKKTEVEQIIKKTGLLPEAHKKIGALSKGYRQRVGLACALLHNPAVLLLDEPTTGLDPLQILEIRNLIKEIAQDKTILLSTHIMQEVEVLCDRVIIINKGEIVLDETLKNLSDNSTQIIEVEFDYRVEEVALMQIKLIKKVENKAGFVYHLHFETKEDMRSKIFDFAHDNGLKILQLNRKNPSLEKLFISLTQK